MGLPEGLLGLENFEHVVNVLDEKLLDKRGLVKWCVEVGCFVGTFLLAWIESSE